MIRNFLFAIILIPFHLQSQSSVNGTFAFTNVPVSPLSAALGGSQIASYAGDLNQLTANPALMDSVLHGSASLSYLNYMAGINQASLAGARMVDSLGVLSAYLRYFGYGSFTETDEAGNELRQFNAADYEVGLSLTRNHLSNFAYGVSFKQVFSSLYQHFAYGVALDVGGYYHSDDNGFTAGLTIDNLGFKLKDYTNNSAQVLFPVQMNIALTKKFAKAPLRFGLQYNNLERWDLASSDTDARNKLRTDPLTGEQTRKVVTFDNFLRHLIASAVFTPNEAFNIMLGYNFRRRLELSISERPGLTGFSLGVMVRVKRFNLQYAITGYHLNGTANHFALSTNLNKWYAKKSLQ